MLEGLLAFSAAFIAANMNAIPGGGTFITYPVLLLMGNSSITANATSTAILWPGLLASLPGFKNEISKSKSWLKPLLLPAIVGSIAGAFILTHTPNTVFNWVAPLLIIIGTALLQFQTHVNTFFQRINFDNPKRKAALVSLLILSIAVYGAYFGAGIGILLLGSLSMLGIKDIYQNIGIKNVISLTINGVAIIYFSLSGIIHWQVVPLMALGAMLGGYTGSHLVHHVNKQKLRIGVVVLGYLIALILFIIKK